MYRDMVSLLSPAVNGDFAIEHFEITDHDIRAIFKGIMPGKYVRLSRRGSVVMSDTMMEKRTNREFCDEAHGDVLVGGLGIGMILMAIQDNPAVNSITVLEKTPRSY